MLDRDVVAVLVEYLPDDIRVLRDSIATAEAGSAVGVWDRHREVAGHVKELKDRCAQAGHSLIIALAGKPGTRRRLMRNGRDERTACVICATEEVGALATGFASRFLLRRARWKFEKLNGKITRTFRDPEWYFETLSIIRDFSFSSEVVLHHAFPPRLPTSFLADEHKDKS